MISEGFKKLLDIKKEDTYIYVLLLSAPILLTLYRYFSMSDQLGHFFSSIEQSEFPDVYGVMGQHLGFWLLVMLIPLLIIYAFFPSQKKNIGMGLGDKKYGLKILAIGLPLVLIIAYLGSKQGSVQSEYPLAKSLLSDNGLFGIYQLFYVVFYYIAWEFFFRGFLLFGLKDRFGGFNAILIQTISSCLVHIDKPLEEILGSIVAGIIFGLIALRAGSFWYCFVLHAALGFFTDYFIINPI